MQYACYHTKSRYIDVHVFAYDYVYVWVCVYVHLYVYVYELTLWYVKFGDLLPLFLYALVRFFTVQ